MGGLVLDILLVYFVQMLWQGFMTLKTVKWHKTIGTFLGATASRGGYASCEIVYAYRVDGNEYTGRWKKPFFSNKSTEFFAKSLLIGSRLMVRYDPQDAADSHVSMSDQPAPQDVALR